MDKGGPLANLHTGKKVRTLLCSPRPPCVWDERGAARFLAALVLSVGLRQRLALARIFLKNPSIFTIDEGTLDLDRWHMPYSLV
jgi:ABC-type phosphate transport system ATPase subunit